MYKVLLVDDEIHILQGIAMLVDWEKCGTKLVGEAYHGQMALEYVEKRVPDIVITDIKMPGMNGIELIEKIHTSYPHVRFIILSGYDEFEYAKTAMAYNVRHYLLKPSNETKIEQALLKVVEEINEQKRKEQFLSSMNQKLERILPRAKEQFLKDYITNKKYGVKEWEYYQTLFDIEVNNIQFRVLILMIENEHEYEHIFALKETLANEIKKWPVLLNTTIGEKIIIITQNIEVEQFIELLKGVQQIFTNVYQLTFTTAISSSGYIQEVRKLYNEALDYLMRRFYLGEGSIITKQDCEEKETNETSFQFDHEELIRAIRNGDLIRVRSYVDQFFVHLQQDMYDEHLVKTHSLELFMSMIRQANKEHRDALFKQIIQLVQLSTFEQIREFMVTIAQGVTRLYYSNTKQTQSSIIKKAIEYVAEHLNEEGLSITKIANEVVYMNSDYLGKLFKKEMGEKFSTYLIDQRIKKAIELFEQPEEMKTIEVAKKVGFGNNPRYFSQVFKKQTGFTPTEYKHHHGIVQ
ncbi:response regulator [Bacillus sp. FJAT-50079]|uniref:response regulator n=1 Tax=Bacillus sp. FJAT-50079 TaxID=2833577 RepID=UPI001BC8DD31|nr:response regulator [Bacillus sp. FJAT-50079]MBS4209432.1 response regulator [Bacillus sp. FJAT-50079]